MSVILAGGLSSLGVDRRERLGTIPRRQEVIKPVRELSKDGVNEDPIDTTIMELGDLLRRTVSSAVSQAAEESDVWSPHPAYILASQMKDRLATPHELAMTMEQYEEVIIKLSVQVGVACRGPHAVHYLQSFRRVTWNNFVNFCK